MMQSGRYQRQLLAPSQAAAAASSSSTEYYVTVGDDLNFYLGCKKFFVAGWNQ